MLLQLRPIAGIVAISVALPMLMAGSVASSWRAAAPPLAIVAFVLWTALFYWLRTSTHAARWVYVLCGLILGILPSAFFYLGGLLLDEPAPPVAMLGVGVVTGCLAGLALCNLSPFERAHSYRAQVIGGRTGECCEASTSSGAPSNKSLERTREG